MKSTIGVLGILLIAAVLWDAFEVIILPRRIARRLRLTRSFYRASWIPYRALAARIRRAKRREVFLSYFGPLSLLMLLIVWAVAMVLGFALIHWAAGPGLGSQTGRAGFGTAVYMSGTTFFTLGLGDVVPLTRIARVIAVVEAGTGFGFLALVISYLPILYQSFSRREVNISLFDARAGSPPTAAELLRRHGESGHMEGLTALLAEWERWAAELMESHLSFPVLSYYRSQHDNQSWISALTTILDTCALVLVGIDGLPEWQARLTFAIARHAAVDLSQVFGSAPELSCNRLPVEDLSALRKIISDAGLKLREGAESVARLEELRQMYEPYVYSLSTHLLMPLPSWLPARSRADNWQTSAFEQREDRG